jgi:hypothetical protein
MSCFVIASHHIQAKRKNSRYRDSEIANQMHAAQIYAEMLGQVCHRNQYIPNLGGKQEVHLSFFLLLDLILLYFIIDSNHRLFCSMPDMLHFTFFMLPFPIHIFATSQFMGLTTNIEFQTLMR